MKTKSLSVTLGLLQGCVLSFFLFIISINKIDKDNSSNSGVTFGECNVWHLLFADKIALLSSNKSDVQYAHDRFSDACLDAGMKINMTKTEIMCLSRYPVQCSFQTNGVTLKQTAKFKYLVVVVVWKGIRSRSDTNRTGAEGLSFYYPRLLYYPDRMLAVMLLSQHRISSSKTGFGCPVYGERY